MACEWLSWHRWTLLMRLQTSSSTLWAVGGRLRAAVETIAELAATRRMLVVLDNCEHVLDAAAACAEAIVAGAGATVLATSREPLRLAAEQLLRLRDG